MRSLTLLVGLVVSTVGCEDEAPKGSEESGSLPAFATASAAESEPVPSAAARADAKREFTLPPHQEKTVKVRVAPPTGWMRLEREDAVTFMGFMRSILFINLTCHGNCSEDPKELKKNALDRAEERFARYAKSTPPMKVEWIHRPAEAPENVITYELAAKGAETMKSEHVLVVDRILPRVGKILTCEIMIDEREKDPFETFAPICKTLEYEMSSP